MFCFPFCVAIHVCLMSNCTHYNEFTYIFNLHPRIITYTGIDEVTATGHIKLQVYLKGDIHLLAKYQSLFTAFGAQMVYYYIR